MKRISAFFICLTLVFSLASCGSSIDKERSDELAINFISAMLIRDEEAMKQSLHPDYTETALPNDAFYNELEKNHFFTVGNSLAALDSAGKSYIEDVSLDGTLLQCKYVARSNELFYDIELIILENDNGYGIIAASAKLNTDPAYYSGVESD